MKFTPIYSCHVDYIYKQSYIQNYSWTQMNTYKVVITLYDQMQNHMIFIIH